MEIKLARSLKCKKVVVAYINGQEYMLSEINADISHVMLKRFGSNVISELEQHIVKLLGEEKPSVTIEDASDRVLIKSARKFEKYLNEFYAGYKRPLHPDSIPEKHSGR